MTDSKRFIQKGFGLKAAVAGELDTDYRSRLIDALRAHGSQASAGRLDVYLAEEFGFCYGVDRAIDYAYETRAQFPDRTIYVTNEIIHNPYVNRRLEELRFRFFDKGYGVDDVGPDDIVLLPAFGATVGLVERLKEKGSIIVDTTCGSVMNVWKRVNFYAREGYTAIVHGKYFHEETVATISQTLALGGHYLVVRDEAETQLVIDRILGSGLPRDAFLERFEKAISPGFDPDRDLERLGVANQTTMLASESLHISQLLEEAMTERYGKAEAEERFCRFDTICSATQDRQDAILRLGRQVPLDLILVIGGYNSSNTSHLRKIAGRFCAAYHIDGPEAILSLDEIEHQLPGGREMARTRDWIAREGPVRLGLTSGASTPNSIVADVLERIAGFMDIDLSPIIETAPPLPEEEHAVVSLPLYEV